MVKWVICLTVPILLTACGQDFAKKAGKAVEQFPGVAKQEYVAGTEDLPIYHGFKAKEDGAVSYDTAAGRIVDAEFYSKSISAEDVRKFYDATLPQLGWYMREYRIYERDGEILKLNIFEKDGKTMLKFNIRPGVS